MTRMEEQKTALPQDRINCVVEFMPQSSHGSCRLWSPAESTPLLGSFRRPAPPPSLPPLLRALPQASVSAPKALPQAQLPKNPN